MGNGSLRPANLEDAIAESLDHADKSQLALKYCTFEFFFQHRPQASDEAFERIVAGRHSKFLKDFWREYRAAFSRERIHDMVGRVYMDMALPVLDRRRANNDGIDGYGPFADRQHHRSRILTISPIVHATLMHGACRQGRP